MGLMGSRVSKDHRIGSQLCDDLQAGLVCGMKIGDAAPLFGGWRTDSVPSDLDRRCDSQRVASESDGVRVTLDLSTGAVECELLAPLPLSMTSQVSGFFARLWNYERRPALYRCRPQMSDHLMAFLSLRKSHLLSFDNRFHDLLAWTVPPLRRLQPKGTQHYARRMTAIFALLPLLPWKPNALEVSAAICHEGRSLGLPVHLVIGMRTTPLELHAWCELHGSSIADDGRVTMTLSRLVSLG